MENYDAIIANTSFTKLSTEEWIQKKKEERESLYSMAEQMANEVLSSPEKLNQYLQLQANLGKASTRNVLLTFAQKPEATFILSAEEWGERGRGIRRGEGSKAIKQFRADKEYTKENGDVVMGYKVERCFDVSQTYGNPTSERASVGMPMRSKIKALMKDTPVPVKLSEKVPQNLGALYSEKEDTIFVAPNMEGEALFFTVARELARADGCDSTFLCECAASVTCRRFGIEPKTINDIPADYVVMDSKDKRSLLDEVREAATELNARIDRNLYAERLQKKEQPER